jgi:hypothetical protein
MLWHHGLAVFSVFPTLLGMVCPNSNKTMAKGGPAKVNAKGKITTWDSKNVDGMLLKLIVSNGLTTGKTPAQIIKAYPQFKKYNYRTFNSALSNMQKSFESEVMMAQGGTGSSCKCCSVWMSAINKSGRTRLCCLTFD